MTALATAGVEPMVVERLGRLRRERDGDRVARALDRLEAAARGPANLLPPILEAVKARVTLGEICRRLRGVFGRHQASTIF